MKNERKTKAQLIEEIHELRSRLATKNDPETEEAYHILVNTSLQALVILQKGRIVFTNPAAENLSGYSIQELQNLWSSYSKNVDTILQRR